MREYISAEKIQSRVAAMGTEIGNQYKGKNLTVIAILKGSLLFVADLVRAIPLDVRLDFITASSYGNSTVSSGNVKIIHHYERDLKGQNVLLVEDIIDTGLTLNRIVSEISLKNPDSIKICSLIVKKDKHEFAHKIDYKGFEIEDKFIVGYGMDVNEKFRNLPYIAVIED